MVMELIIPKSSPNLNIIRVNTSREMYNIVMSELSLKRYDIAVLSASGR